MYNLQLASKFCSWFVDSFCTNCLMNGFGIVMLALRLVAHEKGGD